MLLIFSALQYSSSANLAPWRLKNDFAIVLGRLHKSLFLAVGRLMINRFKESALVRPGRDGHGVHGDVRRRQLNSDLDQASYKLEGK